MRVFRSYTPKKTLSFFMGFGRAIDITGTAHLPGYYSYVPFSNLPEDEDLDVDAIAKDWKMIGNDIWNALNEISYQENIKSPEELQLLLPLDA